jgi:hypothetical protein
VKISRRRFLEMYVLAKIIKGIFGYYPTLSSFFGGPSQFSIICHGRFVFNFRPAWQEIKKIEYQY